MQQFILYNAGTDCLTGDPLGTANVHLLVGPCCHAFSRKCNTGWMDLTAEGIKTRDEVVFQMAFDRKIPILMVLSGGTV